MTTAKYQIRENDGFTACVSKFTVLKNGKVLRRMDDAAEAHRFIQQEINADRDFAAEGR